MIETEKFRPFMQKIAILGIFLFWIAFGASFVWTPESKTAQEVREIVLLLGFVLLAMGGAIWAVLRR